MESVLAMNDFIAAEKIYSIYGPGVYRGLLDAVMDELYSDTNMINGEVINTVIIFVLVICLVLFWLWRYGEFIIVRERIKVRRVMRMVPTKYIIENKSLQAAIARDTDLDMKFSVTV